jgi:hypothetical protein
MVLTWNPDSDSTHVNVDINETVASNVHSKSSILSTSKNSLRPSMGNTNGLPFTETAPIIFPALDELDQYQNGETKGVKEKLKHMYAFTGDYFDRRAQAKYVSIHSSLGFHVNIQLNSLHNRLETIQIVNLSSQMGSQRSRPATLIRTILLQAVILSRY